MDDLSSEAAIQWIDNGQHRMPVAASSAGIPVFSGISFLNTLVFKTEVLNATCSSGYLNEPLGWFGHVGFCALKTETSAGQWLASHRWLKMGDPFAWSAKMAGLKSSSCFRISFITEGYALERMHGAQPDAVRDFSAEA